MKKYIMSFDQGTTSCRCILFDKQGNQVSTAQKEITQIYPQGGWVEHDAMEIWSTQIAMASEAMQRIRASADEIAAIGITNQRETTVVWDKRTGKPVYNAIVWQCRRTAGYCDQLKEKGLSDLFREKTGLLIDSYFSGTKLKWILDNVPTARKLAEEGNLLFGTMDTWLIWNLTGGKVHASDYSNAARTMMYNIHQLDWDEDILKELDIPKTMLPQVFPSLHLFGETEASLLGSPIPIAGSAGDQQAALFGQCCFSEGMAKNTYGTGCFLLMNTGEKPVLSESGLLTTIAWGEGGKVYYALEGSIFIGGAVIQWLRDEMKLLSSSAESEQLAAEVPDTAGVYLVPAFVGLGAPYWDPYARGAMVGLTRGAGRNHIVRAALESIAYQTSDILKAMEEDSGIILSRLKVDGGACANNFLMQFQADIVDTEVVRPKCLESTALGAAFMAGLKVEFWVGKEELPIKELEEKTFKPDMDPQTREKLLKGWKKAVERASDWED